MIIDVSRHQGSIDWPRVRGEGGVDYAIIRATLGATGLDDRYAENWRESGWAGIPRRSIYHYLTRDSGAAQLANIASVLSANPVNEPVVIDCERTTAERQAMAAGWVFPRAAYTGGLWTVCYGLKLMGQRVRIYSNYTEWQTITTQPAWAVEFGFHGAGYPYKPCDPAYRLRVPLPWTSWEMWQCCSTCRVAGIAGNVDVNQEATPVVIPEPLGTIPSQFGDDLGVVDGAVARLKGLVG